MTTKRVLILVPIALLLLLVQSYFWVPTYRQQAKGNPGRLEDFIFASIGDATVLNPAISTSKSSNDIEFKVFDPLLDIDNDLQLRPRLASGWDICEEAYFYVNPSAEIPGRGALTAVEVAALLERARKQGTAAQPELAETLGNIRSVRVLPPRTYTVSRAVPGGGAGTVEVTVSAPERIRLDLARVDPEVFDRLEPLLGRDYFRGFRAEAFVGAGSPVEPVDLSDAARELLPATEHNPVITFRLRPGVTFHDGHVFDAGDVKFTYEAIMDPRNLSPRTGNFEPVKGIEILDPLTVRVTYKTLNAVALYQWTMRILPQHLLDREALRREAAAAGRDPETFTIRDSAFNRNPVGCGPYRFREWKSDRHIILDRFENYWDGPPNFRRFIYRIIPDYLAWEMELYAGTVDYYEVPPWQVERLRGDPRFQEIAVPRLGYSYIAYNMRRPPLDDRRVRLALGKAIDVDRIIRYVLDGQGRRTTGPFAIQSDFYNHAVAPPEYDPEGAKRLLADAGWKPNRQGWLEKDGRRLQFTLITNNGNDKRKAVLAIAQNAWRQLGIDVRTDLLEWSVFIQERMHKLDFDAVVLGWAMTTPDPDQYEIWHSRQTDPEEMNYSGFSNREADRLIEKIRQEYDREAQIRYCHRLHELIAHEQPFTFLYVDTWNIVLDKRIVLEETDANGRTVYRKIPPPPIDDIYFLFNRWTRLQRPPERSD